jgi:hypothetical protein
MLNRTVYQIRLLLPAIPKDCPLPVQPQYSGNKYNTRYDTVEVTNSLNPQIDREAVEKQDNYTSAKVEEGTLGT